MKTKTLASLLFIILLAACGESEPAQKPINPNGESELALLMRAMADEAEAIRTQIASGEEIAIDVEHNNILTAEATEPEKAASSEFKAFAASYLETIKYLKTSTPENVERRYQAMVNGCVTCHQALCPGPLVRIEKLR